MECLNETCAEGENRDDKEIDDQRPFPAISIREKTKDDLESGRGKRRQTSRMEEKLPLTAPTLRNNNVRVMDVVWFGEER